MRHRSAERREPVTRGTGDVFADLGFPDAAERQAKLRLAYALNQVLDARKLSQGDAAKVLRVTQPKVSALRHYKLAGFRRTSDEPQWSDRHPRQLFLQERTATHVPP
jgi:predicted XRE-type DNA-binding protein